MFQYVFLFFISQICLIALRHIFNEEYCYKFTGDVGVRFKGIPWVNH